MAAEKGVEISAFCKTHFGDLAYGLPLISRNTGRTRFTLPKALVVAPDAVLSEWVTESFGRTPE